MTYHIMIEDVHRRGISVGAKVGFVAALLGATALISLSDVQAPVPQNDGAISVDEEWHGNVRRSNWPD